TRLSGGMLYGHEVEKPQWYAAERKRARHRKPGRAGPVKREAVMRRVMNGWTNAQIAREMLISTKGVSSHIRIVLRQEGVKNRHELAAKMGWKHPQPVYALERQRKVAWERDERIGPMLAAGLSYKEIA